MSRGGGRDGSAPNGARAIRQSITPTYDHRETGDRYTVQTRIGDRPLPTVTTRDPFVNHRVTLGWHDLLRGLLRGRLAVTVIVGGDRGIVDDVLELDADCLTFGSTRREEWNASVQQALARVCEADAPGSSSGGGKDR